MDIQAGYYKARGIAGSEQYGTTSGGYDQIAIDVELLDGEYAGSHLTTFLVFSEKQGPYALERLRAMGWTGGNTLVGIDKNEVTVQVKYEQYNGEMKLKVEVVTGGGKVTLKDQMDEAGKRGLMKRLNGMLGGAPASTAARPPAQSRPTSGGNSNAHDYPPDWDEPPAI